MIRFNGELHEGIHEPLVSKKLFDQCRDLDRKIEHLTTAYIDGVLSLAEFQ